MSSVQQTQEQKRAADAWRCVADIKAEADQDPTKEALKKKYGGLVRRLPAHILTSGLGPTLAYLRAKAARKDGKLTPEAEANDRAYRHLSSWVVARLPGSPTDLLQAVREHGSDVYRLATVETLAHLAWLKRFADAELPEDEER